eukprot:CAMPEP_0202478424 /NCGR_PEP_ID=MMETSP1360-20130828/94452_1 /ASSEMBLY_ACC=CAM_ASM_000848 /TAXON_ID=515479 /ORGANISM="Licmophora paradoxa, Strain CCMP2313" /LENGTH=446 /DNA_ID=CAMNT_0049105703 /DNA_START=41 /DNA_END=1378 /DNA_ORIENTATION=-
MMNLLAEGRLTESIKFGLQVLKSIGIKFPKKITTLTVVSELSKFKIALWNRSYDDLIDLKETTDPTIIFAMKMMNDIGKTAFALGDSFTEIYAAVCIRVGSLTLQHGISGLHSPHSFIALGSVHATLHQYDTAMRAQNLALHLVGKYRAESIRPSIMIVTLTMIHPWRNPLNQEFRHSLLHNYQLAVSYGDIDMASIGWFGWLLCSIFASEVPLEEIHRRTCMVVGEIREFNGVHFLMHIPLNWQCVLDLRHEEKAYRIVQDLYSYYEDSYANGECDPWKSLLAEFTRETHALRVAYLSEDWISLKKILAYFFKRRKASEPYYAHHFNYFFAALGYYDLHKETGKSKYKSRARLLYRQMKTWAMTGTPSTMAPYKLLKAFDALCGKKASLEEIENLFQEGIIEARSLQSNLLVGVGLDRLAKLFLRETQNQQQKGFDYLGQALTVW